MFRPDHRTRRPLLLRRLSALAAVGFVLVQVVSGLHLATVRHARCADHGELVHAGGDHGPASASAGPGIQSRAPETAADEHEHCAIGLARETPATVGALALL